MQQQKPRKESRTASGRRKRHSYSYNDNETPLTKAILNPVLLIHNTKPANTGTTESTPLESPSSSPTTSRKSSPEAVRQTGSRKAATSVSPDQSRHDQENRAPGEYLQMAGYSQAGGRQNDESLNGKAAHSPKMQARIPSSPISFKKSSGSSTSLSSSLAHRSPKHHSYIPIRSSTAAPAVVQMDDADFFMTRAASPSQHSRNDSDAQSVDSFDALKDTLRETLAHDDGIRSKPSQSSLHSDGSTSPKARSSMHRKRRSVSFALSDPSQNDEDSASVQSLPPTDLQDSDTNIGSEESLVNSSTARSQDQEFAAYVADSVRAAHPLSDDTIVERVASPDFGHANMIVQLLETGLGLFLAVLWLAIGRVFDGKKR